MSTTLPADLEQLLAGVPTLADGQKPAPYPDQVLEQLGRQDDLDELGAAGDSPNTAREAIKLGRHWIAIALYVGVAYCLKTIRSLYLVAPLWPDAETAWEQAARRHHTSSPSEIPWGVPVWWVNGRYGHVALSIGGGRCLTTDYVETGRLGVAPIAALGAWCGGRLVGWSNDINGVTVWEPADPFGPDDRLKVVQAALDKAVATGAPKRRIIGLRKWRDQLRERLGR